MACGQGSGVVRAPAACVALAPTPCLVCAYAMHGGALPLPGVWATLGWGASQTGSSLTFRARTPGRPDHLWAEDTCHSLPETGPRIIIISDSGSLPSGAAVLSSVLKRPSQTSSNVPLKRLQRLTLASIIPPASSNIHQRLAIVSRVPPTSLTHLKRPTTSRGPSPNPRNPEPQTLPWLSSRPPPRRPPDRPRGTPASL